MFKNTSRRKRTAVLGISSFANERYSAKTKNYFTSSNPITLSVPTYASQITTGGSLVAPVDCTDIRNEYNQLRNEMLFFKGLFTSVSSFNMVINALNADS